MQNENYQDLILSVKKIYLLLLLQDFKRDFMLISKNTESCKLNIMPQAAAAAAAAAMVLLSNYCPFFAHRQQSFGPQCRYFIAMQSLSDAQLE